MNIDQIHTCPHCGTTIVRHWIVQPDERAEIDLHAEVKELRAQLKQSHGRIRDMLENNDGQAWKEARKYMDIHCAANK